MQPCGRKKDSVPTEATETHVCAVQKPSANCPFRKSPCVAQLLTGWKVGLKTKGNDGRKKQNHHCILSIFQGLS